MLEATTSEGFTRWWPAMKELPQVHSSPGLLASLSAFWLLCGRAPATRWLSGTVV